MDEEVDLFWIDFRGNLRFYKNIDEGDSYFQRSYVGHRWLLANSFGNMLEFDLGLNSFDNSNVVVYISEI